MKYCGNFNCFRLFQNHILILNYLCPYEIVLGLDSASFFVLLLQNVPKLVVCNYSPKRTFRKYIYDVSLEDIFGKYLYFLTQDNSLGTKYTKNIKFKILPSSSNAVSNLFIFITIFTDPFTVSAYFLYMS